MEVIRLREAGQTGSSSASNELQMLKSQNDDLQRLVGQKDKRQQDLELQVMEMRQKLASALEATQHQKSTEIQKVFNHVKDAEDYSARFEVTNPLATQALNTATTTDGQQREIWAQELKKAEDRA